METTLIYFSVKAMSATYILYKVWMFIFSPKVYKFWDNQLRYMRMARIRLWKSRKKRMVEKQGKPGIGQDWTRLKHGSHKRRTISLKSGMKRIPKRSRIP